MLTRKKSILLILLALAVFLGWRFLRPMNIFVVSEAFERPVDTRVLPEPLQTLRAEECGGCHKAIHVEWQTSIHSQAWTDPYFQVDWVFDRSQPVCRNCHTPLDRQQPDSVLGFHDSEKLKPVTEPNPDFDAELQHEGVTCAACHYRDGKILGVIGGTQAPHPVQVLDDPNRICVRCHVVDGERWDTFFRYPPCGTVAEIGTTPGARPVGRSGEVAFPNSASLGCVQCHMPSIERPLVEGGGIRRGRQHLWRGGHDPEMVRKAITAEFAERAVSDRRGRLFELILINTGAAHRVPTGTPDRHLSVHLRVLDKRDKVIDEQTHLLKRTTLWRPFIIDLSDTRLPRMQPRHFELRIGGGTDDSAHTVEAEVRYHLLAEERRRRIGYENEEPIDYEVFKHRITLSNNKGTGNQ